MADAEADQNIFQSLESQETSEQTKWDLWRERIDIWLLAPWRIMMRDRRTRYGLLIVVFWILVGTVGVWLTTPPKQYEASTYIGAFQTLEYPLGTDGLGQGLMRATIHATPAMLKMMIAGGVVTTAIGAVVGLFAGYKRGVTERILMTATDTQMAIPGLPLLIVVGVALQPEDPFVVGLILSIDAWAGLSRQLHSQVLALRNESYVEASRTVGLGSISIIRDDIIPNIMPFIMIRFMGNTVRVIQASVGLYFLGVLPFTTLNWGVMINLAYENGALSTWDGIQWLLVPIFALTTISYGIILFSQGLDQLFNPRIRAEHSEATSDTGPPTE